MARAAADGMVVTRTPVRVSFAGGGTDLADYYERHEGVVLSTAIRQYVYVTLKRHGALFGETIRLNYSETETATRIDDLRNDIARECLRFLEVDPPIYVSTIADVPSASGLGSSSAFAVGLLNALHTWRGERASAGQLAEEAAHIEIDMLKHPIGKQDQYATAFGGFNLLRFLPNGGVSVEPQQFAIGSREALFADLLLFFTGRFRSATSILCEQKANTGTKTAELDRLRGHALGMQADLRAGFDAEEFGRRLDESWQVKRELASGITDAEIDALYDSARHAGALGGKLCGAGGGGFLLLVAPKARHEAIRDTLGRSNEVELRFEPAGSSVMLPHMD
jgi:D-glycero-alpha-D-manno-heptose-7-phosphate kinase